MRLLPRRRWVRALLGTFLLSVLALLTLFTVVYIRTEVPTPNDSATGTTLRILYADRSELGRVGRQNRIPVELTEVPEHVQLAVLAAEDRGFYTEPGISPRGIARALLTNVRGGGEVQQGGSTITQQYAKNAFLSSERTYTRKVKEVFIALKMGRTVEKTQILEDYLNTIHFGRQAEGIQVATKAYFGGDVSKLSISQGAMLAATIRTPARLDPATHLPEAKARWAYVLDGMVEKGWLSATERAQQVYPYVLPIGSGPENNDLSGPKGHIITAVLAELDERGFPEDRLQLDGLTVQTTIRRAAQEAAVAAVQEVTTATPGEADLQGALVSVKPGTGEIWAYYGGATGTGFDFANQGVGRQPGSSFKPYVLAAALEQDISLRTRLDGNTGKEFEGAAEPIDNFGDASYGRVDLVEATQRSVNTAYYELGLEVGPERVAELAHAAGIPDSVPLQGAEGVTTGSISLGGYEVHPLDQAAGFATFANRGVPVEPFLVTNVRQGDELLYNATVRAGPPAFSQEVAADATFAMQAVVERGTGRGAQLEGGRPAAGKTGTSSENKDAWFVGYTPQLSTAVWLGYPTPRTIRLDGVEVTGGGFSTRIWKAYMDPALAGTEELDFPEPAYVGRRGRFSSGEDDPPTRRERRASEAPASSAPSAPAPQAPASEAPTEPDPPAEEPVEEPGGAASEAPGRPPVEPSPEEPVPDEPAPGASPGG